MTYQQQIKDPRWQRKRLEVLEDRDFQCENCDEQGEELHVHHPFYRRGAMIWEYDKKELMCLCHKCHKNAHALDERIKKSLASLTEEKKWFILGVLDGQDMTKRLREMRTHDEAQCFIKAENHEHAFGAATFFGIPPQILLFPQDPRGANLKDLLDLRSEYRTKAGLPASPRKKGGD